MIDYFSLAVTHGLLALVALRLLFRADLNHDPEVPGEVPPPPADKAKPQAFKASRHA